VLFFLVRVGVSLPHLQMPVKQSS